MLQDGRRKLEKRALHHNLQIQSRLPLLKTYKTAKDWWLDRIVDSVAIPWMGGQTSKLSTPPMETATQHLSRLYGLDKKKKSTSAISNSSLSDSESDSDAAVDGNDPTIEPNSRGGSSKRDGIKKEGGGGREGGKTLTKSTVATATVAPTKKWGIIKWHTNSRKSSKTSTQHDLEKTDRKGKQDKKKDDGLRHVTFGGAWEVEDSIQRRPTTTFSTASIIRKGQLKKTNIQTMATSADSKGRDSESGSQTSNSIIKMQHIKKNKKWQVRKMHEYVNYLIPKNVYRKLKQIDVSGQLHGSCYKHC